MKYLGTANVFYKAIFNPQIAALKLIISFTGWSLATKIVFCSVLLWVCHQAPELRRRGGIRYPQNCITVIEFFKALHSV